MILHFEVLNGICHLSDHCISRSKSFCRRSLSSLLSRATRLDSLYVQFKVINEDQEQYWAQYRTLRHSTCHRSPAGMVSVYILYVYLFLRRRAIADLRDELVNRGAGDEYSKMHRSMQ